MLMKKRMTKHEKQIRESYFEWIYRMLTCRRYDKDVSYRKLLSYLHDTEFVYCIARDSNREEDGKELRRRYARSNPELYDADLYLDGPCSVLEMMVALAIRCEEGIMDNTNYGDRTTQWFWGMISSIGVGGMTDTFYDADYVEFCVNRLLKREYAPNGKGGLFTIRGCKEDLREVEIWYQLCWYLDTIT